MKGVGVGEKVYAALRSVGAYTPQRCVSNKELETQIDTSDEWITRRTGIKTRYFATAEQKSSDLGIEAAKVALQRAKMLPSDIDLVIVGTLAPDFIAMPSTACIIASALGIHDRPAFDISAACSGFIYLLSVAKAYIESGMAKNILIVGAEKVSSVLNPQDRGTYILFGDGAGAAIISATQDKELSILNVHISADGQYQDYLMTPRSEINKKEIMQCMSMKGNEVFKIAVHKLADEVKHILEECNMGPKDIQYFVPHQANYRIIKAVGDLLNFDSSQIVLTVDKFGNTSAASIPMAINMLYENNQLKRGSRLLLDALGGGLTWGSAILHFDGE
ncbi:3-oxoacyl-ACP synthase [Helicobacter monodelphidis]|uniref:beta-ketoacyl-ACP synthase III n=1 Tax=Helicobacter sp. 15-1451 TaxID=2004995 RepID=UPI000DCE4742|nr:beta-ketoacyl-ACP synthase III [Helicobacter sp. 15-1451]RAX56603.1 3-oxoacyl-ACP synthase [Helicobacter sp. 15-1451]